MKDIIENAQRGDAQAQYFLGNHFFNSNNFQQSIYWLQRAVAQNYAPAQVLLGFAYLHGQGVKADPAKAVELFNAAAIQKEPQGEYHLGLCKWKGIGVKQNITEAMSLFESSARKGDQNAQLDAGLAYLSGKVVKQNIEIAGIYIRAAAKQGNVQAVNILQQTPSLQLPVSAPVSNGALLTRYGSFPAASASTPQHVAPAPAEPENEQSCSCVLL